MYLRNLDKISVLNQLIDFQRLNTITYRYNRMVRANRDLLYKKLPLFCAYQFLKTSATTQGK